MQGKTFLIITDSMGMPRDESRWDVCWPHLFMRAYPCNEYILRSVRYSTTQRLAMEGVDGKECLEWYCPDFSIIQLGICDCAPRLFPKASYFKMLIDRCGGITQDIFYRYAESLLGRKQKNAWVNVVDFEDNIKSYFTRAVKNGVKVIVISIFPPGKNVTTRNPKIVQSVELYNDKLRNLCKLFGMYFVEPYVPLRSDNYTIDGYHLNALGHNWLYEQIANAIGTIVEIEK